MTPENTRLSEFAEFVPYHVFRNVHRDKSLSVVYRNRLSYEIRRNHRSARPGLDHRLLVGLDIGEHLLLQLVVNKRSFFQ